MANTKGGKKDPADASGEFNIKGALKMSHIKKILKAKTKQRTSKEACYATAITVYVILKEVINGAFAAAEQEGKKRILPKHINLAMHKDEELAKISHDILIRSGGVRNVIPPDMLKKRVPEEK